MIEKIKGRYQVVAGSGRNMGTYQSLQGEKTIGVLDTIDALITKLKADIRTK